MNTPDKFDDVIDSRDIIARLEELTEELEAHTEAEDEAQDAVNNLDEDTPDTGEAEALAAAKKALSDWEEENSAELAALTALAKECEDYAGDWQHGETLIRRSYWVNYVQELLEDCGDLPRDLPHYIAIDWDATARNIEADYASVDFDGVEYLIRSC